MKKFSTEELKKARAAILKKRQSDEASGYVWQIQIRCRHTGREQWLGRTFNSENAANLYADEDICGRCNTFSIVRTPPGEQTMYMRMHKFQ